MVGRMFSARLFAAAISAAMLIATIGVRSVRGDEGEAPSWPRADVVAKAFGYAGELEITNFKPAAGGYHKIGDGIWAASYESPEGTFVRATVILFAGGSHLTEKKRATLTKQVAETEAAEREAGENEDAGAPVGLADTSTRGFALDAERTAYGYVAGFGQGGTTYGVSWVSPDGAYDAYMEISYSYEEGSVVETEGTAEYLERVLSTPIAVLGTASKQIDAAIFGDMP